MPEYILIPLLLIAGFVVGIVIAKLFFANMHTSEKAILQERENQSKLKVEELKAIIARTEEDYKTEISNLKISTQEQLEKLENEREEIRREKDFFSTELTRRNAEFKNLQIRNSEQKQEVEKLQEKFEKEFENLANRILEQKSEKFTLQNKTNIQNLLNPLQEKIKSFEEKVNKNNTDFIERHAQLGEQLNNLNQQNIKISEEANNLTKALKGENKTQGNWGELILEKVLEKSGLEKGREYFIQKSYTDDAGNKVLPDVVLHLPNDKRMIIDAKVSLVSYEKYVNEEDENTRHKHLKDHVRSLNTHIMQLSAKKYEDLYKIKSPDFVLMFIPIEPALYLAQNTDSSFFYSAFQKNILLVSPTTLLSTLRTIDTIWSNEKQQQNALEIANHAASLYHKFKLLLDDLETVGNRIKSTTTAYETAMKKLTGNQNLVKDIHKLEDLGISPKQKIPQSWLNKANQESTDQNQTNLN